MSIRFLKGSFAEHRTVDSITVTTAYEMTWNDYYSGFGDLVDCDNNLIRSNFYLPWEGDNFGIYYSTFYLNDCVLTDISMEPTFAADPTTLNDVTENDLNYLVRVNYTWSNNGSNDTKRNNEASSWRIRYETTLENLSLDSYVSPSADGIKKYYWPHKYLSELDPNIYLTKTNDEGEEEEVDYGLYTDIDRHDANKMPTSVQQLYIDTIRDTIPIVQKRVPRTVCSVTAYSSSIKGADLSSLVGHVNEVDFLENIYSQKELALIEKNKLPGYDANDWINVDDSERWQFIDWTMEDLSNGFFEYEFFFEYDVNGWNRYADADVDIDIKLYPKSNFYNVIFDGMDYVLPNDRSGR